MNNIKTALPKLRFREFVNYGEIIFKKGAVLFEPISNKSHDTNLPVLAITQEQGAVPRDLIDYNVFVTDKSLESYKAVEVGDFIISLRSFQGGIEYSKYRGICSPAYIVLRKKDNIVNEYYKYYFKSAKFIRDLNKNLEGIRDGKMVSYDQFSIIDIPKPDKDEQQKIADFFENLDEVIDGEICKLETLQKHKRGLLQKLFPIHGTTVPELRLPEFRCSGNWKFIKLSEIAERITTRNTDAKIHRVLTNSAIGGVVDQKEYFDREIVSQNNLANYCVVETGDYVYNPRISTSAPVGPVSKNKIGQGVMSPLYTVFRFQDNDCDFYEYYFQTSLWHQYIRIKSNMGVRHDRINISVDDFMDMPVPVCPNPNEQRKIAEMLKDVDNLITVQNQKVETMTLHKKGLIQQLFPSFEEVYK